jgi:hypothetical protein
MKLLLCLIIFTDAVEYVKKQEITDIRNEIPLPSLLKGWSFFRTVTGDELDM